MHISSAFSLGNLWEATQSYKRLPPHLADIDAVADMFAVRVTGTAVQPCVPDTAQQVKHTYQVGIAVFARHAVCHSTRCVACIAYKTNLYVLLCTIRGVQACQHSMCSTDGASHMCSDHFYVYNHARHCVHCFIYESWLSAGLARAIH